MIDSARRSWGGFAALAALISLGWLVRPGPLAGTTVPREPQAALAGSGQVVGPPVVYAVGLVVVARWIERPQTHR